MAACTESPATCSVLGRPRQTHQTPPQKPLNQDLRSASGLRAGHRPVTARLPSNIFPWQDAHLWWHGYYYVESTSS